MSNLDARLRMEMRVELKRLHAETGATFVYVTHDQMEALTLSTRMAVMRDGIVQQVGTPREIYETPANLFVAEFLSLNRLNKLSGVVENGGVQIGNAQLALPAGARVQHGQDVIVGLRPDELRLAPEGDIACKVVQSFIACSTTLTTVETASGYTLNVVEPERREHPQEHQMSVICSVEAMLLFNSDTEVRISCGGGEPLASDRAIIS